MRNIKDLMRLTIAVITMLVLFLAWAIMNIVLPLAIVVLIIKLAFFAL